jgi:hypothetical protein
VVLSQYVLFAKKLEMLKGIGVKLKHTSQNTQKHNSAMVFAQSVVNSIMASHLRTPNKTFPADRKKPRLLKSTLLYVNK